MTFHPVFIHSVLIYEIYGIVICKLIKSHHLEVFFIVIGF